MPCLYCAAQRSEGGSRIALRQLDRPPRLLCDRSERALLMARGERLQLAAGVARGHQVPQPRA
jgi:hypothetical protein